jgi:sporulation protein YlmC with PRC-barrel domain
MPRDEYYDEPRLSSVPVDAGYVPETRADWDDDGPRGTGYRRVLSAASMTGHRVRNPAGEDLGKVEEIMLDVPTGRVAYAVISFGGFLGIGDKLFAVPWRALTFNERDREFILNVDRRRLEEAPGFDRDNWPDMADPDWGAQVDGFYSDDRH